MRTPEAIAAILKAFEDGCTYEQAANEAGIGESTIYAWQAENQEFLEQVRKAQGVGRGIIERAIFGGCLTDHKHALMVAERRWPKDWGKHEKHNVTIDGGIDVTELREDIASFGKPRDD